MVAKYKTNEICLEAVSNYPYSIQYIKNPTKEVILLAIKRNPDTIGHVIKYLTEDILEEIIKTSSIHSIHTIIEDLPENLFSEKIIITLIEKYAPLIFSVPIKKITEKAAIIIFNMFQNDIEARDLSFNLFLKLPKKLKKNKNIIESAIKSNFSLATVLEKKYLSKEICEYCFSKSENKEIIKYFPKKFITNEMAIESVSQNKLNSFFLSKKQQKKKEIQLLLSLN